MCQSIMFSVTSEIYIKLERTECTYGQIKNNVEMDDTHDREVTEFSKWAYNL